VFPGCQRRGPWTGGTGDDKALACFQAVAVRAGIECVDFQMLRRSLTTHLRHFGVSAGMASKVLRHSVEVDELWYHGSDEANLRDAVKDVEF
jgi:integrase